MGEHAPENLAEPPEADALAAAERQFQEAVTAGDPSRIVEVGIRLASEYEYSGRPSEGIAMLQELRGTLGQLIGDADLAELGAAIATTLLFSQQEAGASRPWFEESLRLFDTAALPLRSAGMSYNLGVAHLTLGQYDHALSYFERATASFSEGGAEADACDCQVGAALATTAMGNSSDAGQMLSDAQSSTRRLEDPCRTARFLIGLVTYLEWSGADESVYWALDKAADLAEALASSPLTPDHRGEAREIRVDASEEAALFAARRGDHEQAEARAQRLLALGDRRAEGSAWAVRAETLALRGYMDEALDAYRKASDADPCPRNEARLEGIQGAIALRQGRLDEAERSFTAAVEIAEGTSELDHLVTALRSDLAETWLQQGQGWRAIPVFKSLAETAQTPTQRGVAHLNLAVALAIGNQDNLRDLEAANALLGVRDSLGLLAAAHLALRLAEDQASRERARQVLEAALALADTGVLSPATHTWLVLAGAAMELEPRRHEEMLDRAERSAKQRNETALIARIKLLRAESAAAKGHLRRAWTGLLEAGELLPGGHHDLRVLIDLELAHVAIQLAARRLVRRQVRARWQAEATDHALPALLVSEMLVRANPNQRMRLAQNGVGEWARILAWIALDSNADLDGISELIEFFQAIGHPAPPSESLTATRRALRDISSLSGGIGVLDAPVQAPGDLTPAPALSAAFIEVLDDDDDSPLAPVPQVRMPSGRIALERYAKLAEERYGVRPFGETVIAITDTSSRNDT